MSTLLRNLHVLQKYENIVIDLKEIEHQQLSLEKILILSVYIRRKRFRDEISNGTLAEFKKLISKSFTYKLNIMGESTSPCIKPRLPLKKSLKNPSEVTHALTFFITLLLQLEVFLE